MSSRHGSKSSNGATLNGADKKLKKRASDAEDGTGVEAAAAPSAKRGKPVERANPPVAADPSISQRESESESENGSESEREGKRKSTHTKEGTEGEPKRVAAADDLLMPKRTLSSAGGAGGATGGGNAGTLTVRNGGTNLGFGLGLGRFGATKPLFASVLAVAPPPKSNATPIRAIVVEHSATAWKGAKPGFTNRFNVVILPPERDREWSENATRTVTCDERGYTFTILTGAGKTHVDKYRLTVSKKEGEDYAMAINAALFNGVPSSTFEIFKAAAAATEANGTAPLLEEIPVPFGPCQSAQTMGSLWRQTLAMPFMANLLNVRLELYNGEVKLRFTEVQQKPGGTLTLDAVVEAGEKWLFQRITNGNRDVVAFAHGEAGSFFLPMAMSPFYTPFTPQGEPQRAPRPRLAFYTLNETQRLIVRSEAYPEQIASSFGVGGPQWGAMAMTVVRCRGVVFAEQALTKSLSTVVRSGGDCAGGDDDDDQSSAAGGADSKGDTWVPKKESIDGIAVALAEIGVDPLTLRSDVDVFKIVRVLLNWSAVAAESIRVPFEVFDALIKRKRLVSTETFSHGDATLPQTAFADFFGSLKMLVETESEQQIMATLRSTAFRAVVKIGSTSYNVYTVTSALQWTDLKRVLAVTLPQSMCFVLPGGDGAVFNVPIEMMQTFVDAGIPEVDYRGSPIDANDVPADADTRYVTIDSVKTALSANLAQTSPEGNALWKLVGSHYHAMPMSQFVAGEKTAVAWVGIVFAPVGTRAVACGGV